MRRSRRRRITSHRRRPRRSLKSSRNITKFRPGYHRTAGLWKTALQRASEVKYFDRNIDSVDITDVTPEDATSLITLIPNGNGRSARIGQKITIVGLELKIRLQHAPSDGSANTANVVRLQIWLDKQANGTQAPRTSYHESSPADEYLEFANKSNEDRFTLLAEKIITFETHAGAQLPGGSPRWAEQLKVFNWNLKVPKIPIFYSSTLGSITEVRSNNIFIAYQGSLTGTTFLRANYRTHYTDKN